MCPMIFEKQICFPVFRQKIKATIPSRLAYGKKGYPPTIPGTQTKQWQIKSNDAFY